MSSKLMCSKTGNPKRGWQWHGGSSWGEGEKRYGQGLNENQRGDCAKRREIASLCIRFWSLDRFIRRL